MPIISLLKAESEVSSARSAEKLVKRLMLPFGGGGFFFSPKETPMFLLDLTLPADNASGANFDIRLAYAVCALAREEGVKRIRLAARVAEGFDFATVLEKSGYAQLAQLDDVELLNLSALPAAPWPTDTALALDHVVIPNIVYSSDIIISLAKFRAGEGHLFGGALNNAAISAALPAELGFEQRQRAIVDVYGMVTPDLTLVDGLRGESNFQPQQADFLLAGTDAVAADAVLAAIAALDLEKVGYLQLAAQYGLGVGEPADISLFGDDMSEIML